MDWRDARIAELERQLAERDARIAELEAQVAALTAQVERLTVLLGQNSSNSSKPPSSDKGKNPHRNARKGKSSTGRKRGGQKGHRGHHRELLPPEQVDETVDVFPSTCGCCGKELPRRSVGVPTRHQATELPERLVRTTEWRLHAVECACGHQTRAPLPQDAPKGAFGSRLVVVVALLTGMYRLSKRNTRRLLGEVFGVDVSEASVSTCEKQVSEALAAPHAQLHRHIKHVGLVHADETSWREQHDARWLWVASTNLVSFFLVQTRRTSECAQKLLGRATRGAVLVTDRLGSYAWWPGPRQVCWAHVTRTLQDLAERPEGTVAHRYGTALLAKKDAMFQRWHRVRDGTLSYPSFRRFMKPLIEEFEELLDDAATCGDARTMGKAKALLGDWDGLWTFVHHADVPPTNNQAERDLRHAVILRNLSFGTQSERGTRFLERVLSTVETLRKQRRAVLPFLLHALRAHRIGGPAPSLLPTAR